MIVVAFACDGSSDDEAPPDDTDDSVPDVHPLADCVVASELDLGADAVPDARSTATYDARGKPTGVDLDNNVNGAIDGRRTYVYDDVDGRLLSEELALGLEGATPTLDLWTHIYDEDAVWVQTDFDAGADAVVDTITTYTYNDAGRLVSESLDSDANGTTDAQTTYNYDADGNVVTMRIDANADRISDMVWTYTYDDAGHLILAAYDADASGSTESISTYTNDELGRVLTEELDDAVDGSIDARTTWTYDCPA
jgi:hypothetical protein